MAKLVILAAVLSMSIFIASAYRTTLTTVEVDGDVVYQGRQSEYRRCRDREQLQRVDLRPCEKHVTIRVQEERQRLRGRTVGYDDKEQQCCQELQRIQGQQCQCEALQQIAETVEGRLPAQRQVEQLVDRELQNLAQRCGMQSLPRCEIRHGGKEGWDEE